MQEGVGPTDNTGLAGASPAPEPSGEAAPAVSRLGLLGLRLDLELDEGRQAEGEGRAGTLEGEATEGAGDGPAEAGEGGAEGLGSGHVSVS